MVCGAKLLTPIIYADHNLYNTKHTVHNIFVRKSCAYILSSGGAANNYLIECNYKFIARQVSAARSAAHVCLKIQRGWVF